MDYDKLRDMAAKVILFETWRARNPEAAERVRVCPDCLGSGSQDCLCDGDPEDCTLCDGNGSVTCQMCHGTGRLNSVEDQYYTQAATDIGRWLQYEVSPRMIRPILEELDLCRQRDLPVIVETDAERAAREQRYFTNMIALEKMGAFEVKEGQ